MLVRELERLIWVVASTITPGLLWALLRFEVGASSLPPRAKCQNQALLHDKPTMTQQMSALITILVIHNKILHRKFANTV